MGLETAPQRSVQVPVTPLVTSADPTITSAPAVQKLADAFSRGFITTSEVMDRMGEKARLGEEAAAAARKDIKDPNRVIQREAQAATAENALKLANAVGAPIPKTETGDVDFDTLFGMVPDMNRYVMQENRKAQNVEAIDKAVAASRTGGPILFEGRRVSPDEAIAIRDANKPAAYAEMFGPVRDVGPAVLPSEAGPAALSGSAVAPPVVRGQQIISAGRPGVQPSAQVAPTPVQGAAPQVNLNDPWGQAGATAAKPTEAQGRAFLSATRMGRMQEVLTALENDPNYDPTNVTLAMRAWIADKVPNWLPFIGKQALPDEHKAYLAAGKTWVQGLLRLESGAAITDSEQRSYEETFLPDVNDPPELVREKNAMRVRMQGAIEKLVEGTLSATNDAEFNAARMEYLGEREKAISAVEDAANEALNKLLANPTADAAERYSGGELDSQGNPVIKIGREPNTLAQSMAQVPPVPTAPQVTPLNTVTNAPRVQPRYTQPQTLR